MKTYRNKLKQQPSWARKSETPIWEFDWADPDYVGTCSCSNYLGKNKSFMAAYVNCPNCLGYGRMPIPWSEVS